jgi:protein gp37
MNKQKKYKKGELVSRGIEWIEAYGIYEPYTWNPIKGCQHACQWLMQNGERAQCYAKSVAEGLAQAAYPNGFSHLQFDDEELMRVFKLKEPSGIFCDSMSDLLGLGVPEEWTERVLEVIDLNRQHIFFALTKRVVGLPLFVWPENVWLGVSAPPTYMHKDVSLGHKLSTSEGRLGWYRHALMMLSEVKATVRWSSIEPLSDDFSLVLQEFGHCLDWAVIGAASNGRQTIQPDEEHFANVLDVLDTLGVPVFFKGNIDRKLAERHGGWREDWPYYEPAFERLGAIDEQRIKEQQSLI